MAMGSIMALLLSLSEVVDSESLRFAYSTEQRFDTSCGLSTISCLLTQYWNRPVDELTLAREHLTSPAKEGVWTVSMADLVQVLRSRGLFVSAYKMNFQQLTQAVSRYAPVLVHYDKPEGHFSLVLSIQNEIVITADPAEGVTAKTRTAFESRWSGYTLLAAVPGESVNSKAIDSATSQVSARMDLLDRVSIGIFRAGSP